MLLLSGPAEPYTVIMVQLRPRPVGPKANCRFQITIKRLRLSELFQTSPRVLTDRLRDWPLSPLYR